jgi:hypothetical protein
MSICEPSRVNVSANAETEANWQRSTSASSAPLKPVACIALQKFRGEGHSVMRPLTLKRSLTLLLAAASKDQPLWVHRGEVLCCFEAQSNIGPYYDNCLASKVHMFCGCNHPTLILDEFEKADSSHDIRCRLRGRTSGRQSLKSAVFSVHQATIS